MEHAVIYGWKSKQDRGSRLNYVEWMDHILKGEVLRQKYVSTTKAGDVSSFWSNVAAVIYGEHPFATTLS